MDTLSVNIQVPGEHTQCKHTSSRRTNAMETHKLQADKLIGNSHAPWRQTQWKHAFHADKLSGNTRFRRTNSVETRVSGGQTQWKHAFQADKLSGNTCFRRTTSTETNRFQADKLNKNKHVPSGQTPWKHASRTYSRYSTHTHTPTSWSLPNVPCEQRTTHTVRDHSV